MPWNKGAYEAQGMMLDLSDPFLGALDISIPIFGYFGVAEGVMPEFGQVLGWCESAKARGAHSASKDC